jgi:lysophospholipase L1-like esterase
MMSHARRPRFLLAVLAAASLVMAGSVTASPAAHAVQASELRHMAALGDSITLATMSCGRMTSCTANSWSTGSNSKVQSHLLRLRGIGATELVGHNNAVSGAKSGALNAQAGQAVAQGAQYVTIAIGANDACTATVAEMTPTETFRLNVEAAFATLDTSASNPEVFVAAIPSLYHLWEINYQNRTAVRTWNTLKVCQSMLANPTSLSDADNLRRLTVQQRVNDYNAALQQECAEALVNCLYGASAATHQFTRADISTRDYFHPSEAGQKTLASITWPETQWG